MEILKNTDGIYIYGFIPTYYGAEQFRKLDGIEVFNIPYKKVSAVVSKKWVVDYQHLGTETLAKLLIDHQRTIEHIMELGFNTIIPMRLGTFANHSSEVITILEKGYDLILETLEKITNKIEIDVVALWSDFGKIISEVALSPEVIGMKTKIETSGAAITQADQLAIGYLVKKMLDETLAGKLNFKLVGPLPCYSFFTIEVKDLIFEEIDAARKELGLDYSTSEKEIKQAYLNKVKQVHPDTNSGDEATANFDRINKAFHTMTDFANAVKPASRDEAFSLKKKAFTENSFLLKIKE
jgi:hypothetical protein